MDQESRDANSLLVELDRCLKSQNIGEQSEAVVRFNNLFQKYQLPLLINSACLKLAEAFRCASNFIRVQICEVFERNQVHLNKINNVHDFYRNIFTVTTSNDPIARSITLITLGNIAPIVSDHKSIHYYISSSLESTVECELSATIACAASYVKQSPEFACNIYPRIVSIIDSESTSIDVKIRALSVLDHEFYNAYDAMTVRSFLINIIEKSKLKKLICNCLTLSTKISHTSLTHIVPQIELLLKTFLEDSRQQVRVTALRNLKFLAEKSPHIWESNHVEPLISHLESCLLKNQSLDDNDQFLSIILSIFCKLLTCKCNFISKGEKLRIFQKCYKIALNNHNVLLCSMAFELLTVMSEENTNNTIECQSNDLTTDTYTAIKTFLTNSIISDTKPKKEQKPTLQVTSRVEQKVIYRHIVRLCQMNPHFCSELLVLIFARVSSKDIIIQELSPYMTEFMCAILQSTPPMTINPDNCWKIIKTKSNEMSETNLLNLSVLYFQSARQNPKYKIAEGLIDKITQDHDIWFGFKVMRQAMRYGHYSIGGLICKKLHEFVTTDTIDFYFDSLGKICLAETILFESSKSDLNISLKSCLPIYEEATSTMRASFGHSKSTDFQLQYLLLRIKTLKAHSSLRQCCKTYDSLPITYTNLMKTINLATNSNENAKVISLVQQMPKISKEFRLIAAEYDNLVAIYSDCDYNTIDYLRLLKSSCIIMADVIDGVSHYGNNLQPIAKLPYPTRRSERVLEHRDLEKSCLKLIELIKTHIVQKGLCIDDDSIGELIELLKKFSDELLECSFIYPKYFFQPLQINRY